MRACLAGETSEICPNRIRGKCKSNDATLMKLEDSRNLEINPDAEFSVEWKESVGDETSKKSKKRMLGKCKWFDGPKGYGFIEGNDKIDYFVHQTSIEAKGWRNLEINQDVEFEVVQDGAKRKAINVTSPGASHVKYKEKKQEHVCFEFLNSGICTYGKDCKFSHERKNNGGISSYGGNSSYDWHAQLGALKSAQGHRSPYNSYHVRESRNINYPHRADYHLFEMYEDPRICHFPDTSNLFCYNWQKGHCHKGESCKYTHFPTE